MAGGAIGGSGNDGKEYPGKITLYVFLTCLLSATGGLIFGYDLGISGGVTSMSSFLQKFFPSVYQKAKVAKDTNQYCKFDSELLTLFTSSLYVAALLASLVASKVTRKFGRRMSMCMGGVIFVAGGVLDGAAMNVAMLIIGRLLLGVGIGFANQSVPVYLAEVAPAKYRGLFNMWFQLMITIGIFVANLLNFYTAKIKGGWGWRVSLGLAAVPGLIIAIGAFILPETPNSLLDRGKEEEALRMLKKIRGTEDVDEEFRDIQTAAKAAKAVQDPWHNIVKRKYRPQLIFVMAIPFFQQLTGINVITFYAPVLYQTIGFGDEASLYSAVISGAVNSASTLVAIFTVDKIGRRTLFLEGGTQMFITQCIIGGLIGAKFGLTGAAGIVIPKWYANLILVCICFYVAGFAWSWGPLGWLVPSEILPLEIRSAGQSVNVVVNMFFTFVIAQVFLAMLCHMKFFMFYFFAVFVFTMTVFIFVYLPETKGVPIEEMILIWKRHRRWGKYISDEDIPPGLELASERKNNRLP